MEQKYLNTVEGLVQRIQKYNKTANVKLLRNAFNFAYDAHKEQLRKSGELYFEHPLAVSRILTDLKMDYETIAGGILHDVIEDTDITVESVEENFGANIARLVDGVTKISELKLLEFEARQAENFRKMLLSMVEDIRVILIKFADRLHNMRTLEYLPEKKQRQISLETKEVYAPLAHRLGLAKIKWELEDLSFKYLEPDYYREIQDKIDSKREEREYVLRLFSQPLRKILSKVKVKARFESRAKHFYSIFNKITKRGVPFDEIFDLLALRIIVDTVPDCYHALGIVHSMYTPIQQRFKDYIATPKSNGYQSLHTTVIGPEGKKVEVQIRTEEMHITAEEGIAAHWKYKEGRANDNELDEHMSWLRNILEWEDNEPDSDSFIEHLKINLFQDEVFVFTPKGDLHRLPANATPVDFAFSVHSAVGLHTIAAKVNGRIVPLSEFLKSGDTVEIITSANQKPNEDWLKFIVTSKARNRIKKWIRDSRFENSKTLGEEMMTNALKEYSLKMKEVDFEDIAAKLHMNDSGHLFASIGRGETKVNTIIRRIVPDDNPAPDDETFIDRFVKRARKASKGIRVAGIDNVMISFGKCCNPVPGEPITGIVTRGRGIVVHTNKCKNLANLMQEQDRIIDVLWDVDAGNRFLAGLYILGERRNKFLSEISDAVTMGDGIIVNVNMNSEDSLVNCILSIEVYDLNHLNKVITKLKRLDGVISVGRLNE